MVLHIIRYIFSGITTTARADTTDATTAAITTVLTPLLLEDTETTVGTAVGRGDGASVVIVY